MTESGENANSTVADPDLATDSTAFHRFEGFSDVQVQAALLLLEGQSAAATARALKVNRSTVFAWKADPDFACLLADLRKAFVERAWSMLVAARVRAAHTVVRLLDSKDDAVALRAAQSVLNLDHRQG